MRIVTWNCCKGPYDRKVAWLNRLGPDIAVLQECPRPPHDDRTLHWFGEYPSQGVAVRAAGAVSVTALPPAGDAPAFVRAYEVSGPVDFNLVSVWAHPDPNYVEYVRRGIRAYDDVLRSGPTVIAGDFNSSAAFDPRHRRYSHSDLVRELESLGMVSAYHCFHGEEHGHESRPTHFWRWKAEHPFHLDYCFVPDEWAGRIESVEIGDFGADSPLSDHRPLIVDLFL